MAIERTIFDFKISKPFSEWASVFDSEENNLMLNEGGVTSIYRGINKKDPQRAVVVFQAKEGVALKIWADPNAKEMIESNGHIYSETDITRWTIS